MRDATIAKHFSGLWIIFESGIHTDLRKSVHHAAAPYLRYPLPVPGCTGYSRRFHCAPKLSWAPAIAPVPLKQMHHGDRTALTYNWGRRLKAWFARYGSGVHNHAGGQQPAQTDLLPAAARSDRLGVH